MKSRRFVVALAVVSCAGLTCLIRFSAARPANAKENDLAQWRERYVNAKPDYERLMVCLDAVEKKVIARGQAIDVLKSICGDDLKLQGSLGQGFSGAIVYFDVQHEPPPDKVDAKGRSTVKIAYRGWYMGVEYWSDSGTIEYYKFSDVHRAVGPRGR